ncbi:hypothetical protein [Acinetobacter bereziniae]|uniref:hypothetical protein n=1 Tax=Acinetobacter bereziniae TaxID=106648 RepID=UPI002954E9FF|nr:hypothetical protein [Acinetobacter bereziniae]MDV8155191.1 hypothetical protein [Acinetobacter bereziniae]
MKNNLIALVLAVLIAVVYFACSKVITPDQLQNFSVAFIFGLSFALLFRNKSKVVSNQQLGNAIGNAVRSVIAKEKRQGGFLGSRHPEDHCATDVESCKKRLKDQNGFVKTTQPKVSSVKISYGLSENEQP